MTTYQNLYKSFYKEQINPAILWNLFCNKWNDSIQEFTTSFPNKLNRTLQVRIKNSVRKINLAYQCLDNLNVDLNFSTLTSFATEYSEILQLITKLLQILVKEYPAEQILVFLVIELNKKGFLHVHAIHSKGINIGKYWEAGMTRQRLISNIYEDLCYLMKSWPDYYLQPETYAEHGLTLKKKLYIFLDSQEQTTRKIKKSLSNKDYYLKKQQRKETKNVYSKKLHALNNVKSRLLKKIKASPWKKIPELRKQLRLIKQKIKWEKIGKRLILR